MAEFPFSLVGTKLNYALPKEKRTKLKPEDLVVHLDGTDSRLAFSTPESSTLRKASHRAGTTPPDQFLDARFLNYIPPYITICRDGGGGILSGPFSGCWYIRYFKSGAYHAAHVGTNQNQAESQAVKEAFVAFTQRNPDMSLFSCFNPHRVYSDQEKRDLLVGSPEWSQEYVLAYIDSAGKCYSVFLAPDANPKFITKSSAANFPKPTHSKFQTRKGAEKIPGKPTWNSQGVPQKAVTSTNRYTVKAVREVPVRTWADVRVDEFPQVR